MQSRSFLSRCSDADDESGFFLFICSHKDKTYTPIFNTISIIEAWGRGYEKIEESFSAADLPMPEAEASQGGVWMRIKRRNPFTNVGVNVVEDVVEKLTERQGVIIKMIQDNPTLSAVEMSQKISVTMRTIQRDLATLQKKSVIFREGSDKFGHWVVVKQQ